MVYSSKCSLVIWHMQRCILPRCGPSFLKNVAGRLAGPPCIWIPHYFSISLCILYIIGSISSFLGGIFRIVWDIGPIQDYVLGVLSHAPSPPDPTNPLMLSWLHMWCRTQSGNHNQQPHMVLDPVRRNMEFLVLAIHLVMYSVGFL